MTNIKLKKTVLTVMFISLSTVGAMIKIPSFMGSIALDSLPALIAAVLLGPIAGGVTAAMGHILSSLLAGFPLGMFHGLISLEMLGLVMLFGYLYKKLKIISYLTMFIGNAFLAPLPFYFLISPTFYYTLLTPLMVGTFINIIGAYLLIRKVSPIFSRYVATGEIKG
ncbi:ECF transporter S component [Peribacillus alkalitolerans]|uniref:ECF transporter S component n=1 Tax=Peribacillus alkalitolerans TaxID=1550385 RepID=UPI0013D3C296|nr:ECF transporter S component [Peribacillus alkalitolerans]